MLSDIESRKPAGGRRWLAGAAAERVGESVADFVEPGRPQRGDSSAKGRSRQRLEIVEGDDAISFESVVGAQSKFRGETPDGGGQVSNDHGVDSICDGIAREDENGPIAAASDISEPDLAPLHAPNTSVQSVSSTGHASFGHAAASAVVRGWSAYRSASRSHRRR